ncbi:MAG TPA: FMN-binding negative transcriptional regulator [Myxococcota bacterium]|nr:FMN-binding negative transcriptional regulator [Myxococcota bacterium]HNH48856.1 FMN-binding negative transcriptional regulator [Myxococcota bacterium]
MYNPALFRIDDADRLADFLGRYPFATLISGDGEGLDISHLPLLLSTDAPRRLQGHMARANPQWRSMEGKEVRVLFQGPHGYISPSWYEEAQAVPTWNYMAVHIWGRVRLVQEPEPLLELLERLVQREEARFSTPWVLDRSDDWTRSLLAGIVGFEIDILRMEGKFKLSQNRPPASRQKVVATLAQSPEPSDQELARWMAEILGLPL